MFSIGGKNCLRIQRSSRKPLNRLYSCILTYRWSYQTFFISIDHLVKFFPKFQDILYVPKLSFNFHLFSFVFLLNDRSEKCLFSNSFFVKSFVQQFFEKIVIVQKSLKSFFSKVISSVKKYLYFFIFWKICLFSKKNDSFFKFVQTVLNCSILFNFVLNDSFCS